MARSWAVVGLLLSGCGAAADSSSLDPRGQDAPPSPPGTESPGSPSPPRVPEPFDECRPSPDVNVPVELASIPKGVTADFAVFGANPAIAVTPDGDATLVWRRGAVFARAYRGSQWLDVETVSSPDGTVTSYAPSLKLAALPSGGVAVAFHEVPTSMSEQVICVRQRSGTGAWSKVASIARTGAGAWQDPEAPIYELAADPAGSVTVLVRALSVDRFKERPSPTGLLALHAPAGGGFGAPSILSETPSRSFSLTAHPGGEALALWWEPSEPTRVAAFSHDLGWRHSAPSHFVGGLSATVEIDGSTSVLGVELVEGIHRVRTAKRAPDGAWGDVIDVGAAASMQNTRIVGDETGRALATWHGYGSPPCLVSSGVALRDATGKWGPAELIPGAPPARTAVASTALSRSGHTAITWRAEQSGANGRCSGQGPLYLSWISPSGTWSAPMLLDAGGSLSEPTVALTSAGRALVAWRHEDRVLVRWVDAP